MQLIGSDHDLQCPVSVVFIHIRVVDHVDGSAVFGFIHEAVGLGKYHGFHGVTALCHHSHPNGIVVSADGPQTADPKIFLGKLRFFIALSEGLQAL